MIRKIFQPFANLLSTSTYINLSGKGLILPFYHTVSDQYLPHIKHLYQYPNLKIFEKNLDYFLNNFTPVGPDYLLDCVSNPEKIKNNAFFLSFDDGFSQFYSEVAPILQKKGVPATIFINTNFVDNKSMFFRLKVSLIIDEIKNNTPTKASIKAIENDLRYAGIAYSSANDLKKLTYSDEELILKIANVLNIDFSEFLKKEKPYMSTDQIKELAKKGFTIGAHSKSHPYYPTISEEQRIAETNESMDFVIDKFNQPLRLFSFPFTDYAMDKTFFDKINTDLSFGTANLKSDSIQNNFQRIGMEVSVNEHTEKIIKTEYMLFLIKKLMHRETINR
ncbi:MAG: polysaccharide deacetylase family protein [Paludibacter sp.]|nr:polysaccharide deacetylase family protein [Paludibacter sp.]